MSMIARCVLVIVMLMAACALSSAQVDVEVGEPSAAIQEAYEQATQLNRSADYLATLQQDTHCTAFDMGFLSTEGEICVLDDAYGQQLILYAWAELVVGSVDIIVMRDGEVAGFENGRRYAKARLYLEPMTGEYEVLVFDEEEDMAAFNFSIDDEGTAPVEVVEVEPSEAIVTAYREQFALYELTELLLSLQQETHCSETEFGTPSTRTASTLCVLDDVYSSRQVVYIKATRAFSTTVGILLARDGEMVRFLNNNLRLDRYVRHALTPGEYEALVFDSKDRWESWTFSIEEEEDA